MTILNQQSDGLYNVLIVLVRNLIRFSPDSPEDLYRVSGSDLDSVDAGHLSRTLTRWTELGLFASKPTFCLAEPYRTVLGSKPDEAEARLPRIARQLALAPENNAKFWDAEGARSADFSRGAAWILAQDSYTLPDSTKDWEVLLRRQLADAGTVIVQNDTRWNGLRSWMPYLGLARNSTRFDPDPTDAVRDALPDVFKGVTTLLAGEFLERVAEALPILDGGRYRREVEEKLKEETWPWMAAGHVSTSLSRALQRLDREGAMMLEQRSDTGEGAVLTGRNRKRWRDFSHVTLKSKKGR